MSAENLAGAISILQDAEQKLTEAMGEIQAVVDGSITDAKEQVRVVFAAAFSLSGLNEAIGMIEEAENRAQYTITQLAASRAKVEEVRG